MVDVRGDVLRPPHGTTPAAVKSNIKSEMRSKACFIFSNDSDIILFIRMSIQLIAIYHASFVAREISLYG